MIASSGDNPSVRDLVKRIAGDIESGASFGDALARHPRYFDKLFVNLVKPGNKPYTGNHARQGGDLQRKKRVAQSQSQKCYDVTLIVIIAALVVSGILLIWVIPQFKEVFSSFGADLPAFTLMVIGMSDWLKANWWIPLLGMIVVGYSFSTARRKSKAFDRFVDRVSLSLPIIGNILNLSAIARFARTLATMFAAGVPLVESMDSVAGATGNAVYEEVTLRMQEDISRGVQLNTAMQTTQAFPNFIIQMTRIGEESGRVEDMLSKVADYYEEQVDLGGHLIQQIEPLIMAVLGVIVGVGHCHVPADFQTGCCGLTHNKR